MDIEQADKLYHSRDYSQAIESYRGLLLTAPVEKQCELREKILKSEFHAGQGFEDSNIEQLIEGYLRDTQFNKALGLLQLLISKKYSPLLLIFKKVEDSFFNSGDQELFKKTKNLKIKYLIEVGNFSKIKMVFEDISIHRSLSHESFLDVVRVFSNLNDVSFVRNVLIENLKLKRTYKTTRDETGKSYYDEILFAMSDSDEFKFIKKFIGLISFKQSSVVATPRVLKTIMELFVFYSNDFEIIYELYKTSLSLNEAELSQPLEEYLINVNKKEFKRTLKFDKELNPQKYKERNQVVTKDHLGHESKPEVLKSKEINYELINDNESEFQEYIESFFDFNKKSELNLVQMMNYLMSNQLYCLAEKAFDSESIESYSKDQQVEILYLFSQMLLLNKDIARSLDVSYRGLEDYKLNDEESNCFYYLVAEAYYLKKEFEKAYKYYKKVLIVDVHYRMAKERVESIEQN